MERKDEKTDRASIFYEVYDGQNILQGWALDQAIAEGMAEKIDNSRIVIVEEHQIRSWY